VEGREELVDGVRNAANLAAKSGGSEFVSIGGVFIRSETSESERIIRNLAGSSISFFPNASS
jgi:hypothetical protein